MISCVGSAMLVGMCVLVWTAVVLVWRWGHVVRKTTEHNGEVHRQFRQEMQMVLIPFGEMLQQAGCDSHNRVAEVKRIVQQIHKRM